MCHLVYVPLICSQIPGVAVGWPPLGRPCKFGAGCSDLSLMQTAAVDCGRALWRRRQACHCKAKLILLCCMLQDIDNTIAAARAVMKEI